MGFATVAGGSRATAPSAGILASNIAVGSKVKLMESGNAVEYLVVHQGLPSSLYDSSCNGCWLLRKDCLSSEMQWNDSLKNNYATSYINSYLNSTFLNLFDSNTQEIIKQVKIPDQSGSSMSQITCKIFLVCSYEVGFTESDDIYGSVDGAKLSYFDIGSSDSAKEKRVSKMGGSAEIWWLRSRQTSNSKYVHVVWNDGDLATQYANSAYGVRPALILPSNALFDADTMILKGVA